MLWWRPKVSLTKSFIRRFPCFYKNILLLWKHLTADPKTTSGILSQNLWFNKHEVIDNSIVNFIKVSQKNISFVDQWVSESCQFKKWQTLKEECHLENDMYFQWTQVSTPNIKTWKNKIKQNLTKNETNFLVLNHHIIRNDSILILSLKNKLSSKNYSQISFLNYTFDWGKLTCYHK